MAIATTTNVKLLLGISGSAEDDLLALIVAAADDALKAYLRTNIEEATYTEHYRGNDRDTIYLRQLPVNSITSVHVDPEGHYGQGASTPFGTDSLLTAGEDYVLPVNSDGVSKHGALVRINNVWPGVDRYDRGMLVPHRVNGSGNIKVVYTAGYAAEDIPADIIYAANQLAAEIYTSSGAGELQSEGIEGYTYTKANAVEALSRMSDIRRMLRFHRRVVV